MSKFWQQLLSVWSKLEIPQKATIILAGLGFLGLVVSLALSASKPDYRLLAKGLSKSQVAEIATYLDSNHVPYSVIDNETAIMVPSANLYKVRNELAQQDMLGDGAKGFEILGKSSSMWESTFSEHKTYDRAVAGELERNFRELNGVRSARVLIDRPQPSPFVGDDSAKPKASVKLDMKPGTRLSDRQIAGIIHLTAGAVAGLSPDRVEIMDGSGLLTPKADDSGAGMAQTTLEAEVARENYLTRKAQEQLDAVLGPNRSQVRVSVKLDFTKRTEATSDPTSKVVLEETANSTNESTETANPGGVAGTAPNVEGESRPAGAPAPLKGNKTKEETTSKYVVGKKSVTQEDEVGRVRGMNVAILLPFKKTLKPKVDDKGKPTDQKEEVLEEYSQADKDRFKELVLNAIGFNAAKDIAAKVENVASLDARFTSSVQSMELYQPKEDVAQAGMILPLGNLPWTDAIGYGVAGITALVIVGVARGQLKRSHKAWADAEERARAAAEEAERKRQEALKKDDIETKPGESAAEAQQRVRRAELRDAIRMKINEDPAAAAAIIRKWLYEA